MKQLKQKSLSSKNFKSQNLGQFLRFGSNFLQVSSIPKIVLAEPKTRFYNSGSRLVLSFSDLVGIQILGTGNLL